MIVKQNLIDTIEALLSTFCSEYPGGRYGSSVRSLVSSSWLSKADDRDGNDFYVDRHG